MKKLLQKYEFVIFGAALFLLFLLAMLILIREQEAGRKAAPTVTPTIAPTITPTPTDGIDIVFVDGLPTAILRTSATQAPTATEKPTPTPTETPSYVPTATGTPIPTKKPTNTPKPTKAPSVTPKTVQKGKAGTYTVERGGHDWKPYARYQAITAKNSQQYKLQKIAKTDKNGLRYVTDADGVKRFCVALGIAWAGGQPEDIGRCLDVVMANGSTLHCVLGDVKKLKHSQDGAGRFGSNGELLEFQVDMEKLPAAVRNSGDVSKLGGAFSGEAVKIIVYDKNVLKRN